jgi:hypothetical protein
VDTTVLVWDMTGRDRAGRGKAARLSAKELDTLWADLAGTDAARAYEAACTLGDVPDQALALVKERLTPVTPADLHQLDSLFKDLDSEDFAVRDEARRRLEKVGEEAEPAVRKVLGGQPSPEVRRRLGQWLENREGSERLRALRAVELVERLDTPGARQFLEALARGMPEARLTGDARAALDRLNRRPTTAP